MARVNNKSYLNREYWEHGLDQRFNYNTRVTGRLGLTRHKGYFTPDNPYARQMNLAHRNKDIDALYERSVEYQADKAILDEQRAYDREVLAEQRAYDHPLAEMQRQREAGYNPDIIDGGAGGGVSSGSSAQLAQHEMYDQHATSQFGNAYADAQQRQGAWSTAGNFINNIASAFSSVVDGISKIRMMPANLNLANAQANSLNAGANLSNAQAGEILALQGSKKRNLDASSSEMEQMLPGKVSAQGIANSGNILSQLLQFGGVLTPDSDITPLLSAMGVSEGEHDSYKKAFGELMKNPKAVVEYNRSQVQARKSQAENIYYTSDYFNRVVQKAGQLQEMQLDFEVMRQGMENTIQQILVDSEDYASDVAEAKIIGASNSADSMQLLKQKLEREAEVYVYKLEHLKQEITDAYKRYDELSKGYVNGTLSLREEMEYEYLTDAIPMLEATGPHELDAMFKISRQLARNRYLSNHADYNLNGKDMALQNLQLYWGEYVTGAKSSTDIANMWVDSVIKGLGVGAQMYVGSKLGAPSSTTTTTMSPSYDGTMVPISQTITNNNYFRP